LIEEAIENSIELSNDRYAHLNVSYFKFDEVEKYLKKINSDLNIFSTDKGQCIFGYKIECVEDVWDNFVDVDNFIVILKDLKIKFKNDLLNLNVDESEIVFERMENDNVTMYNPKPCVINWN
jgi:hypothetical protein